MLKNTEWIYNAAKKFQDARKVRTDQYEKDVSRVEKYRGSAGYSKDMAALQKSYNADMAALQNDCRESVNAALNGMLKNISKRTAKAPTSEQLRLIELLRMKEKPDEKNPSSMRAYEATLDQVAQSVKDCPVALDIVNETARNAGILKNYSSIGEDMSSQTANDIVRSLGRELNDFIKFDTTYGSRFENDYHRRHYGEGGEDHLIKRELFDDSATFYKNYGGMNPNEFSKFSAIVDGVGGDET